MTLDDYRDKYPLAEVILMAWEADSEADRDYAMKRADILEARVDAAEAKGEK